MPAERAPGGHRLRPGVAVLASVLLGALAVATGWLDAANAASVLPTGIGLEAGWVGALAGLAQFVPGMLLLRRLPRHPIAWVLVVSGAAWVIDSFCGSWTGYVVFTRPGLPGASVAFYIYQRLGSALLLGLPLLLLLFPDGRLPRRPAWRRASILSIALTALLPCVLAFVPSHVANEVTGSDVPGPLTVLDLDPVSVPLPDPVWRVLLSLAFVGAWASMLVPLAVVVGRHRRARGERRAQLRWLVWAAVVDVVVLVAGWLAGDVLAGILLATGVGATSAAVMVAVTRHRLYDIDRLLPATFVYAALAALVVAIDALVFAVAGAVLGQRDSALVAIGVVAAVYGPLRDRVSAAARRLLRGERDDPYAVVSTLAQRLELSTDPSEQLLAVVRSVAEAFRSPFVSVEIEQASGEVLHVEHGRPGRAPLVLPVVYRGETVGRLLLEPAGRSALSEKDQRLLGDVVRQAAAAARASELSLGLQRSREGIVLAREEERRRLRRDLHDSLGPSLAAITLRIDTARNLMRSEPERADEVLATTTTEVAAALVEVRRLAHDLRPPALDELGLIPAVQEQARRLSGDAFTVRVEARDLGDLPAGVEVAAYRIVSEALANVVRHASARTSVVTLTRDAAALRVEVRDDGRGILPDAAAGVGMLSLRERADELGGSCQITCPREGGTHVRAVLPVDHPAAQIGSTATELATMEGQGD